jgi:transposase
VSLASIATAQKIPAKEFEKQYKNHLSNFKTWNQKSHAEQWMIFSKNIGEHLSIDEVAVTNGELYTVITNKAAHGKKGVLAAMVEGTKVSDIAPILHKIPLYKRNTVTEITLDMAESMEAIARSTFPKAKLVTDRFHVQQLVSDAVQEIRIGLRRETIQEENKNIKQARKEKRLYHPKTYENGDTKKQLLARSRYPLFKPQSKWTVSQRERAEIVFREYPKLEEAYELSMMFRNCYESSKSIPEAKERLNNWYQKVEDKQIDSFLTAAESIRLHETTILNYFLNRSTNASAESFNAKLKNFRAVVRGIRDKKFHLFRVATLYGYST